MQKQIITTLLRSSIMKKLIICALVVSVYAMPLSAAEVDTDHLMFPEDVSEALAAAEQQEQMDVQLTGVNDYTIAANDEVRNNAIDRNFTSRRAYKNRSVKNKNQYGENEAWVGATQKIGEERKLEQVKRLNTRFISRRAYRH